MVWGVPKTSGPIGVCGQVIVEKILGHLCDNSNGGYSTRIWSAKYWDNEMLHKVFQAQPNQPAKLDWSEQIQKDLNDFKVKLSLEEIKSKSTDSLKNL